jgi:gliding motility-associated-like protein
MENLELSLNDDPRFSIVFSSNEPATVTISIPQKGFSASILLNSNETKEYVFPPSVLYSIGSEIIGKTGIQIISDKKINCQAYHYRMFFSEATKVPSIEELGNRYIILAEDGESSTLMNQSRKSGFVVAATKDQTTLQIIPSERTLGLLPAGVPHQVVLNKGETYQIESQDDLSGTEIISDNPVAVFSGAVRGTLCPHNPSAFADSHMFDLNLPVTNWGQLYYAVPFEGSGISYLKVVASQDNTLIRSAGETYTLNKNEYRLISFSNPLEIESNVPFGAGIFHGSAQCNNNDKGDPNFMILYPVTSKINRAGFYSSDTRYTYDHYLTMIVPGAGADKVYLDGQKVENFLPVGGRNGYMYKSMQITPEYHNIVSDSNFTAYVYGKAYLDAYTYSIGEIITEVPESECSITIPNLISPNGDGLNDAFQVPLKNPHIAIFNRWGGNIFEVENYANNWPEREISAGVYFYSIDTENCSYKGWINILE